VEEYDIFSKVELLLITCLKPNIMDCIRSFNIDFILFDYLSTDDKKL